MGLFSGPPPAQPPPNQRPLTGQIQQLSVAELAQLQGDVQTLYESSLRPFEERERIARATDAGRWTPGTSQPR